MSLLGLNLFAAQTQAMRLTPQMRAALRLLQLPSTQLRQEIRALLERNPFLDWAAADQESGDGEASAQNSSSEAGEGSGDEYELEPEREYGDVFGDVLRLEPDGAANTRSHERAPKLTQETLTEHLQAQVRDLHLEPTARAALFCLIDALDERGYFIDTPEEIAQTLAPDGEGAALLQNALEEALPLLRNLEPAGVGAQDLGDCLQLQLQRLPSSAARNLALRLCEQPECLQWLSERRQKPQTLLLRALDCDAAALAAATALLRGLQAAPARAFSEQGASIVVPDLLAVREHGRHWGVELNLRALPALKLNRHYASALENAAPAWRESWQEARWFLRSIAQRQKTLLRVGQAIAAHQQAFFERGAKALQPLTLRSLAGELGLHETTISRTVADKFLQTPHGTLALKHFFSARLGTGGEQTEASAAAARALIRECVQQEDTRRALSDDAIAAWLKTRGILCARRTVAKYREQLGIAPKHLRREPR